MLCQFLADFIRQATHLVIIELVRQASLLVAAGLVDLLLLAIEISRVLDLDF